jgi:hypothetical protein
VAVTEVVLGRGVVALAGRGADVAQRDAGDAVLREQALGLLDQRGARRLPSCLHPHRANLSHST